MSKANQSNGLKKKLLRKTALRVNQSHSFLRHDMWWFFSVLGLDLFSKQLVLKLIPLGSVHYLLPFFNIVHVQNKGISFGLFPAGSPAAVFLLIGVTLGILLFLLLWYRTCYISWVCRGLVLISAGAVGNLLDRFRHGGVVDFLDFHLQGWHFPAFNVADSAITLGAMILILFQFLEKKR